MDHNVEPMHDLNQQPHHLHSGGKPGHKKSLNKKMLFIVGGIALVVILAIGVFLLLTKDTKDNEAEQSQNSQQQDEESTEPTMPPAEAAQLLPYKSEALNIEITHRKDWTVAEDAEKKLLLLTSPKFAYQTSSGESKKGVFTVRVGYGASEQAQTTVDDSIAVRDSLLIGYDAPTEEQRHYTNVSYAGADETAFKFFIVTGSVAFKNGISLSGAIIVNPADFLIAGGFGDDKQQSLLFDSVPPIELEQYSAYEQALAIVKSLKVY